MGKWRLTCFFTCLIHLGVLKLILKGKKTGKKYTENTFVSTCKQQEGKLLIAASTSCSHPWGVTVHMELQRVFHSWSTKGTEIQGYQRCYLSCNDWQTISFTFNQTASRTIIDQLRLLCPSLPGPAIMNGNWFISGYNMALWTLRGVTHITSFATRSVGDLFTVSHLVCLLVNCQNLWCMRTMFKLKFIHTGFILSIMHSERMLHPFKSS